MSDITEHPDPRDADLIRRLTNRLADGITSVTLDSSTTPPTVSFTPDESLMAEALADLSRLREERDALTEISGVEYCTVHDGIQIEGNSDDCDQADTNPDDECRMVALLHVAPSPDPKDGEQ